MFTTQTVESLYCQCVTPLRPPCRDGGSGGCERRTVLAAGRAEEGSVLRQPGFIAKAFAGILHDIHPRFGIALQTFQDRSTLVRNSACLVIANGVQLKLSRFGRTAVRILSSRTQHAAMNGSSPCAALADASAVSYA